jgi:RNA polymerase sigma-70 factor, ECF subfamily
VTEAGRPREDSSDSAKGILGDLLYADTAAVGEDRWVGLVQAIAAGDERALQVLFERTHRIVFTLAVRITNNRATAEELTLDVFHDVWRRASTYDATGGSIVGWILNQARSRALDRLRFDQRKKRVNPDATNPLPGTVERPPDAILDIKEAPTPPQTRADRPDGRGAAQDAHPVWAGEAPAGARQPREGL